MNKTAASFLVCAALLFAPPVRAQDISMQHEVEHAIDQGLAWLKTRQAPDGSWSNPELPALTALALTAAMGDPAVRNRDLSAQPEYVGRGYGWLLGRVQPDGGIYGKGFGNYNTAISMMALLLLHDPKLEPTLRAARAYVAGQQIHRSGSNFDGGIGYGDGNDHSDLSNTMYALEALAYTRGAAPAEKAAPAEGKDLDWQAALSFLQRCQNLPEYNKDAWASDDPKNKGGFIYTPGEAKGGTMDLPAGKKALRSYGSMSYAGFLSYLYADLKHDDPRVSAAYDWLRVNYTLEENPGMGPQGLYYYYHLLAKALTTYGVDRLELKNGDKVNWREDMAKKLINLQKPEGNWQNENGRWFEKDPVLVTAYSVIVLELVYRGL